MTKKDKLLTKLQNSPNNIRPRELERVLEHFGFKLISEHSTHHTWSHPELERLGEWHFTLAYKKESGKVKPTYVKITAENIEKLREVQEGRQE